MKPRFRQQLSASVVKAVLILAVIASAIELSPRRVSAQAAISFVQVNSATPPSPSTTVTVRYTSAQGAGDLNVVVVGWNDDTTQVSSVADTLGNSYVRAVGPTVRPGFATQSIYYAANIAAAAANANTVTVTFDAPAVNVDIRIAEYRGTATSSPVDVTAAAQGSSSSSGSGAVFTTNANDLLVAANIVQTHTTGAGTSFTSRTITNPDGDILEDRIVTATGSYSASAPISSTGEWIMQMVAFRAFSPDAQAPTAPGTPVLSVASSTQLDLTWPAATDNVGVTGYFIERCAGAGCSTFAQVGTSPTPSFSDSGLSASTSYSYRVRATDAASNVGPYSATASATTQPPPAIAFVQVNSATPQSPTSIVTVPFAIAQTAADLNVVVVGWNDASATVQSVTDAKGNAYSRAVGPTVIAGTATQSIYYAANIAPAAANTNTVTVTFDVPAVNVDIRIAEYNGIATTSPVDVTAAAQGSGTISDSGAVTTTSANALLVGANTVQTHATGPGASYTQRVITSPDGDILEDRLVTSIGSYNATAPISPGGWWIMQMVAFRAAASGDTQAPSAPGTPLPTVISSSQINLTWPVATDDVGVTGYLVERCAGAGCGTFAQIGTTTTVGFSDIGLNASTSYTYRMRATDAANNLGPYSPTASATTLAALDTQPPTAPGTPVPNVISTTQINLTWGVATDNVGVTGYLVERCAGAGCSLFAQTGTSSTTSFNDNGLTASTTYSYRVRAADAANNLGPYSATASATTQAPPDTQAPTAPGTPVASAVSSSQINLTWPAATDNVGVTAYLLERCSGTGCGSFAQIATPTTQNFSDTGLSASTSYSYRVRATDAAANIGPYSGTGSATTQAPPAISFVQVNSATPQSSPTSVPVTFTAAQTAGDLNVVVVGWNDATTAVQSVTDTKGNAYSRAVGPTVIPGSATQSIYYAANIAGATAGANTVTVTFTAAAPFPDIRIAEYSGIATVSPVDVTAAAQGNGTLSDSGAAATTSANDLLVGANTVQTHATGPGTSYTQRVITSPDGDILEDRAVTSTGTYNASAPMTSGWWIMQMVAFRAATADTTSPTAPGTPLPSVISSSQINLTWPPATDNVAVTGYLVERCSGAGCSSFAQVATPASPSLNDIGLSASTSYSYRVRATDAASNIGPYSAVVTATTLGSLDTQAPTAPGTPLPNVVSSTQINLTWPTATDNVGVTGYLLERCAGAGCGLFAQIAIPATVGFNDTGLTPSTSYSYRVRATDAANNLGPYSATATAVTTGPPDLTISKSHTGNFSQGQVGATYTLTVTNGGSGSTASGVTVADALPSGLTATAMSGAGWICSVGTLTCTRSDVLAAATSYPSITLTVNVSGTAPASVTNSATVSGGGEVNTANDTANDVTAIAPASSGLVAAYSFSEASGTTVADQSGNGHTGTVANATWTTSGKYGQALQFNGTSTKISIPDATDLHLSTAMTLEGWVNPSAVTSAWRDLIYKGNDDLYLMATTTQSGRPAGGGTFGGTNVTLAGTSTLPLNTWTHVATTYDGATLVLYVNGTQVSSVPRTGALTTSISPLEIGGDSVFGQYFKGTIDEIRIYNVALPPSQIQADMNAPLGSSGSGPDLTMTKTHPGAFTRGQSGVTYTLTVTNSGAGATTAPVTVTDAMPAGLTATAAGGSGWSCTVAPVSCTRSDVLGAGASYPPITLTVDVASNAPASVTNIGSVSGGGETYTANNTASDVTAIAPSPSGLVAAYSFGEGAGTTVTDASGSGNSGSIANATWTTAGRFGNALQFNGTNAWVSIADADSLDLTTAMTAEAWVKPFAIPSANCSPAPSCSWMDVIHKDSDRYYVEASSNVNGEPEAGGIFTGGKHIVFAPSALPINAWTHLALTYDSSTIRFYVNGALVASEAETTPFTTSINPLFIGGDQTQGQFFNGLIDEVRIYNTALTQTQIQADMFTAINVESLPPVPDLTITKTHSGAFSQGQNGATYTLTVTNSGTGPTVGAVNVTDALPSGLTATAISGTNWTCTQPAGPCTRNDLLAAGGSYPPLTLTVNVSTTAPASVINTATVSGGGETNSANDIASDATTITSAGAPADLTISKTHSGNFSQGQAGATYTLTVANLPGSGATSATVTVTDALPVGFTPTGLIGTGWSCSLGTLTCTRNDALAAGLSYPAITLTVTVAANAPASVTNTAAVSGGGETNMANDSASDVTTINPASASPPTFVSEAHSATDGVGSSFNNSSLPLNVTGTNPLIIAAWHAEWDGDSFNASPNSWTVTRNGVPGTLITQTDGYNGGTGNRRFRIYYWANPPAGTNTIAVSNPNTGPNELSVSAILLNNVSPTTPLGAVVLDVSATPRTTETETAASAAGDLVVHVIADAVCARGILTSGETSVSVANDGVHCSAGDGDASLWVATEPGAPPTTSVGSSGWPNGPSPSPRVLNGVAIVVHGTGPVVDTQAPTAPASLSASATSGNEIDLSWTAATDNVAVTGYRIERCQGSGCSNFTEIAAPSGNGTTFADTTVVATTSYSYRVRATDAAANFGPYSNTSSATTLVLDTQPPSVPGTLSAIAAGGTQVNLSWGAATDNVAVTGYIVRRCQGAGCTNFATIATAPGTTFGDTGLSASTTYTYVVLARDAANNLGPSSNAASATTPAINPTLVAAYSFDEGSGSTVGDSSGHGNTGTIANATWTTAGKYGNALSFNGTSARVTIADAASLHLSSAMTLEAWVRPSTTSSSWRDIIYRGNDNYYLATFNVVPVGGLTLTSSTNSNTFGASALPANTWTHVAQTFDGGMVTLYVNGVPVATTAITGSIQNTTNPLEIGSDHIYGQFFQGLIDDVRVYNVALTASQIQADMATPVSGP